MQAGAAGGGREEVCILPAGGPGRRRRTRPGKPARAPAGTPFTRRPGAARTSHARGSRGRTGSVGTDARRW